MSSGHFKFLINFYSGQVTFFKANNLPLNAIDKCVKTDKIPT